MPDDARPRREISLIRRERWIRELYRFCSAFFEVLFMALPLEVLEISEKTEWVWVLIAVNIILLTMWKLVTRHFFCVARST